MPFCTNCGASVEEGSIFCETCGFKQVSDKQIPQPRKRIDTTPSSSKVPVFVSDSQYRIEKRPRYPRQYRRKSMRPIFAGFAFIVVMLIAFSGIFGIIYFFSTQNPSYEFLGELPTTEVAKESIGDKIFLNIENSIGSISISTVESLEYAVQGRISVWGTKDSSLNNANGFDISTTDNYTTIHFTSAWYESTKNPYTYELEIFLAEGLNLEFSIVTSTGELFIDLTNVIVDLFEIHSSTGSQYVSMTDVTIGAETNPTIICSVGEIDLSLTNISYSYPSTTWSIDDSTGSVNVEILQQIGDINTSTTRSFNIDTSIGEITVTVHLMEDYSCRAIADTSLGSINLPDPGEDYTSENYGSTLWEYFFNLDTSLGDINFYYVS